MLASYIFLMAVAPLARNTISDRVNTGQEIKLGVTAEEPITGADRRQLTGGNWVDWSLRKRMCVIEILIACDFFTLVFAGIVAALGWTC